MKKLNVFSKLLLVVLALTFAFAIAACNTPKEAKVEKITLNQTAIEITLGEDLDYSTFTVTVEYDDKSKNETLPLTKEMITDGLSNLSKVGTHELTVSAKGATTKLTVTVKERALPEISLNQATAEITVGDDLDYSKFTVTVKYKDGSQPDATLPLTEDNITEGLFNLGQVGTHTLTVTVMGATTTLTVTVKPLVMTGVSIANVTKTYDGLPAALTPTGLPAGAQVAYTYYEGETADESKKVDSIVDAGTYFVKAVVSATNYENTELTVTVVINKKHIAVDNLTWSNTGYRYTGEEITLAAKANGLPEYITYQFTAKEDGEAKATESGYYTAVAHFTSTDKNYTVDESCELTWRIIENTSLAFSPWYSAENGKLAVATFEESENGAIVLNFGEESVTGTVEYTETITVTFPEGSGYALTVEEGVMSLTKDDKTVYLLSESVLNNFVGEYSTLAEDIKVALDLENATLKFVVNNSEENLTIKAVDGKAQLCVDGTDMVLTYNAEVEHVKFDGYANPADYNQVASNGIYLLTKEEAEELKENMAAGAFVDYEGKHTITVAADKSVKYDGISVQPYAVYYIKVYTSDITGPKMYLSISTNKRNGEFTVYDDAYRTYYGSTMTMYVPADYKSFFGTYYPKTETGFDTAAANKVSFMEHEGYYRIYIGSTGYVLPDGEISFSLTDGVLTATLTKGDAEPITATFNGGSSVTIGDKTYSKTKTLFSSSSYTYFYNIANGKYIKDNGNGTVYIYGTNYPYKSLDYTANGLEITITVDGEDKKLIASGDARYVVYDGVVHVSDSITNTSNGRANATYYNGEDTVTVSNTGYTLKIDGVSSALTDLAYSIVDDGNDKGRTVIQVTGKVGEKTYTILHYSLTTLLVDNVAYAHSTFVDIMGSEFKPTADSQDVFKFEEDGKMYFRGEEIFLNGTSTYTNFNLGNLFYSFDAQKTNITFHDSIVWNVKYYFTAYFDFNGAYISEDGTKIFYFDESTVYYNGTNTTSFKAKGTETGAKVTISNKDAIFTSVAGGAHTLVYDGVNYTKVSDFSLAPYYGTYTVFDGSSNGIAFELKTNPGYSDKKIVTFVIYNGEITPVVDSSYDSGYYLIKNTDAATSEKLPVLAVQKKFVNLLGSTTLNGKQLDVVLEAVPKANSTDYITTVSVKYDGETATISGSWTFTFEFKGVKYIVQTNEDAATKAGLPLLVFESWWDDYDGTYTYNGKTLKVEFGVDASGETPVPALKFTYDNEVVSATITDVDGGKLLAFTKGGVNYKGVMGGTPAVAVYTETEFNFFFADNLTNKVNGKDLVLIVKPTTTATEFNLASSSYDGKELTFAKYMSADSVIVFANADGYYAYDIVAKKFYTDIVDDADKSLFGLNYKSNASYGQPLYNTTIASEISSFDKTNGKVGLTVKMGGYTLYNVTSITPVAGKTGEYIVVGRTYNSSYSDVSVYLIIDGSNVTLAMAEEYAFPGTYAVNEKNLVIVRTTDGKYTASYDGGAAVAITPDFTKRSFLLNTADKKSYMVTWTYTTDFTFTVSEVSADAMAFVGYSYSTYITNYSASTLYELTITYTGNDNNGKATYSIYWEQGRYSGTVTGTLSADGQKIEVSSSINYNNMNIYLNKNSDDELKYIMLAKNASASNILGKFAMGDSEVIIGVDSKPTYDYDDEVNGYGSFKFSVTLDGKKCSVATAWSTSATTIEFSCDGKTYTATYASGSVTVAEKTAA